MSTLGFADALSQDGVKFLAASPETMLAPGTPTAVAEDIANNLSDPVAMAKAVVRETMHTEYGMRGSHYAPAAAMDVLDLDAGKMSAMRSSVKALDHALATAARSADTRDIILADAKTIDGMVRFDSGNLPWHADRPAIALYDTFASDSRLSNDVRAAAATASKAVANLVRRRRLSRCRRFDRPLRDIRKATRSVGPKNQRDTHHILQRSRCREARPVIACVVILLMVG
jgi:hypothetical protein